MLDDDDELMPLDFDGDLLAELSTDGDRVVAAADDCCWPLVVGGPGWRPVLVPVQTIEVEDGW